MKTERDEDGALEGLLKAAYTDDLPADIETGMRERIRRFRADPSKVASSSTAWAWLSRRTVWAALSILMLVAGILLQGAKTGSPLADRISSVKSAYASLEPTRR
jgi:hypothetical protein